MFRHACAMALEGIVSKRVASRYKSGSCVAWVKVKNPAYERRSGLISAQSERGGVLIQIRPHLPQAAMLRIPHSRWSTSRVAQL